MVKQMPWNGELYVILIDSIIKKSYAPEHGKTDETWHNVNEHFFLQPALVDLKDDCYVCTEKLSKAQR